MTVPMVRSRFTVLLAVLLLAGCGPGGYSGATATVQGKVTAGGKDAPEGCTVTFIADGGHVASGKTGPGGAFQLTVAGKPQIPAASYKASVTPPTQGEMSQADYEKMMSGGAAPKSPGANAEMAIPAKYRTTDSSGLTYQVKAGPNTIDIELK